MTDLVKQILDMLTGNELENALWVRPDYNSSIRKAGAAERLLTLENIYKLYVPSNLSTEIHKNVQNVLDDVTKRTYDKTIRD